MPLSTLTMTTMSAPNLHWRNVVANIAAAKPNMKSPLRKIDAKKKNSFDRLGFSETAHVLEFLDVRTIEMNLGEIKYFQDWLFRETQTERRIALLNNIGFRSNINADFFESSQFNDLLLTVLNGDVATTRFLLSLLNLRNSPFVIGGSVALILASLRANKAINLNNYKNSDINIYLVSDAPINEIDFIIKTVLFNFMNSEKCAVYSTNELFEIVFVDKTRRKIQIIRQIKKNIDIHMEFVDLPCTQIGIGQKNNRIVMWSTHLAALALESGINVINDPINTNTIDWIIKYQARGFLTIVQSSYGRIVAIFDEPYRHEVDATFEKCVKVRQLFYDPARYISNRSFFHEKKMGWIHDPLSNVDRLRNECSTKMFAIIKEMEISPCKITTCTRTSKYRKIIGQQSYWEWEPVSIFWCDNDDCDDSYYGLHFNFDFGESFKIRMANFKKIATEVSTITVHFSWFRNFIHNRNPYRDNKKFHTFKPCNLAYNCKRSSRNQFLAYLKAGEMVVFRDFVALFLIKHKCFKHTDGVYRLYREEKRQKLLDDFVGSDSDCDDFAAVPKEPKKPKNRFSRF